MARLNTRFSRFFKPSRRSRLTTTSPSLKSMISKPIVLGEDDTRTSLMRAHAHTHTHSHSSSVYTLSDAELQRLERAQLNRSISDDIDTIIACYSHIPPTTPVDPFADIRPHCNVASEASWTALASTSPDPIQSHCSPTPSSVYSSPSSSPPTRMKAKLERFRDTPPPAPGWEKVSFGRETGLFGPDAFSNLGHSGEQSTQRNQRFRDEVDEQMAGRRKDWRGEFARRGVGGGGYVAL